MTAPLVDSIPDKPATDRFYRVAPDTLTVIGRDTTDGEEHELWDERAFWENNEEQIHSFMAIGVRMPLLVRKGPTGRIEVVDGRRRTIESREANRRLLAMGESPITVSVYFSSTRLSAEMLLTLSVELNARRIEDPPSVKARKAKRMADRKISIVAIARSFGVTTKAIENWIASLDAPPDVIAAVDLGMIPVSAIAELVRAPEPQAALEELLAEEKPGRLRAAAIAKAQRTGTSSGARLPRGAVSRVLAAAEGTYSDDFLCGVRFAKGALPARDAQKILKRAART